MIKVNIKNRFSDWIVKIGECHTDVEHNIDRIKEVGYNMITIVEMTLGEEILEKCKTIEVKISEVYVEVTTEMKTLEEVEVGLGETVFK